MTMAPTTVNEDIITSLNPNDVLLGRGMWPVSIKTRTPVYSRAKCHAKLLLLRAALRVCILQNLTHTLTPLFNKQATVIVISLEIR